MNRTILLISIITSFFIIQSCQKENSDLDPDDIFNLSITYGSMTDQERNKYRTVTIGTQIWMAENLKTTRYNDGSTIPHVKDKTDWSNLRKGAYCWYNNNADNKNTYGALYNWFTVSTGKLCPKDWHVPTDEEWAILIAFLGGGNYNAGEKMKSMTGWYTSCTGITNESGFSALPSGYRSIDGVFGWSGDKGGWWSSTETSANNAWSWSLYYGSGDVYQRDASKVAGCSIRCVRDN